MGRYPLRLAVFFAVLACLGVQIYALSPDYSACQLEKNTSTSPLQGCPKGTLFVSPTDFGANFTTIQAAIESL
jgi:hypothetical protein